MGDKQPRRLVDAFFDLDVDKINTVFKHLDASERSEFFSRCQTDLISGNLSVRHILAGSQLEFERVVSVIPKANQKDYLERLSEDTINLFNEYGEEYQSKEYLEMLT
jgi:hypothetical protein